MKTTTGSFLGLAALALVTAGALIAPRAFAQEKGEDKEMLAGKPSKFSAPTGPVVSPLAAMKAAGRKVGGTARMAIYEFDEGKWIYGVIVVKDGALMEVDVDPKTGVAGATEKVTPEDEAKEFSDALTGMTKKGTN